MSLRIVWVNSHGCGGYHRSLLQVDETRHTPLNDRNDSEGEGQRVI
ncbi:MULTISPECIES: hypothetical protein [Jannaschia]|nr:MULTISPECIES: hypothetical protein [unclassified Jannaschia]